MTCINYSQYVGKYAPFLRENYPVLPVRIAEGIMGKLNALLPSRFAVIVLLDSSFISSLQAG